MAQRALVLAEQEQIGERANIRDLLADWQAALELRTRAGEMSSATLETYRRGVQKFMAFCDRGGIVGADTIRAWIGDLRASGCKPASVNTWLAGVRAFFAWAVGARRVPYNPTSDVRCVRRGRQHSRDSLTDAEVNRVLALPDDELPAGKRDRAIMHLMAFCGVRTVEVHRADVGDLETRDGHLVLRVRGKGRDGDAGEFVVIVNRDTESAIHDWLVVRGGQPGALFTSLSSRTRGGRLSLRAISGQVKGYYRAAGICSPHKTTHSLRHSAISSAVRHGAPVQKVQSMARHADIRTTMIYYHELDRLKNPAEAFVVYNSAG